MWLTLMALPASHSIQVVRPLPLAPRCSPITALAGATRGQGRARLRALKELSTAMIDLKIPGGVAVEYAEILVDQGVSSARELPQLSKQALDSCGMRRQHRKLLLASGILLKGIAHLNAPQAEGMAAGLMPLSPSGAAATVGDTLMPPGGAQPEQDEDDDVEVQELWARKDMDGMRVDAALAVLLPPLSRSYFGELCAQRCVSVDGERVKKSAKLTGGARLEVRLRPAAELSVTAEDLPLEIVYEDQHVLAVNKAPGMVVHPAPGHWNGTFVNALAYHLQAQSDGTAKELPDAFGDGLVRGVQSAARSHPNPDPTQIHPTPTQIRPRSNLDPTQIQPRSTPPQPRSDPDPT